MNYEPNRWRVLTTHVDGKPSGNFYVFRNPPNAAFVEDASGNRRVYTDINTAQSVADGLNREAAS